MVGWLDGCLDGSLVKAIHSNSQKKINKSNDIQAGQT